MTDALDVREAAALDRYHSIRRLARAIVDEQTHVVYSIHFHEEDQIHGDLITGGVVLGASAIVPLMCASTTSIEFATSVSVRKAFASADMTHLRCFLSVSLHNYEDAKKHEFGTTEHDKWIREDDVVYYNYAVPDRTATTWLDTDERTPRSVAPEVKRMRIWPVSVYSVPKRPQQLASVTFVHDPDSHPRLMAELIEEAVDAHMVQARDLLEATEPVETRKHRRRE